MPVITQEKAAAPERRKRGNNGHWLFCLLPGALVLLLAVAAVRPLQLGPYVLTVDRLYLPRCGWNTYWGPSTRGPVTYLQQSEPGYAVVAPGRACGLYLGDWLVGVAWFKGHPLGR